MIRKKNHILVVDHVQSENHKLYDTICKQHYTIVFTENGLQAIDIYTPKQYPIVILNISLPHRDAITMSMEIRKRSETSIIIFIVPDSEEITSFENRYEEVNFFFKESDQGTFKETLDHLVACIPTDVQRDDTSEGIQLGRYTYDAKKSTLSIDSNSYKLTKTERIIFHQLLKDRGKWVTNQEIMIYVWGSYDSDKVRYVNKYVSKLRKYLLEDKSLEILNKKGQGYMIVVNV